MTSDPNDVSEQCSVTKTALDDKLIEHQENQQMPSNTNTKGQRKLYIFVLFIEWNLFLDMKEEEDVAGSGDFEFGSGYVELGSGNQMLENEKGSGHFGNSIGLSI